MSGPEGAQPEQQLKAEEDDGSAQLQPEDGGAAQPGKTQVDGRDE